jgi:hypothetical protein
MNGHRTECRAPKPPTPPLHRWWELPEVLQSAIYSYVAHIDLVRQRCVSHTHGRLLGPLVAASLKVRRTPGTKCGPKEWEKSKSLHDSVWWGLFSNWAQGTMQDNHIDYSGFELRATGGPYTLYHEADLVVGEENTCVNNGGPGHGECRCSGDGTCQLCSQPDFNLSRYCGCRVLLVGSAASDGAAKMRNPMHCPLGCPWRCTMSTAMEKAVWGEWDDGTDDYD